MSISADFSYYHTCNVSCNVRVKYLGTSETKKKVASLVIDAVIKTEVLC